MSEVGVAAAVTEVVPVGPVGSAVPEPPTIDRESGVVASCDPLRGAAQPAVTSRTIEQNATDHARPKRLCLVTRPPESAPSTLRSAAVEFGPARPPGSAGLGQVEVVAAHLNQVVLVDGSQ